MLKAVLRCIGGAFLALILLCVCNQASANNSSNMSASILVGDGVEITLIGDNPLVLDLNPNTKQHEAKSIKLKVATSNAAGYKLTMSAEGDITDLRKDDRTATIPTLGTGESYASVDNFPANRWGYKQDSGSFIPFEPTELLNNDSPTSGDITELTFGSKVDYSQAPGSYSIKITFLATANVVTIEDMQNLPQEQCTTTPSIVTDTRDNQRYTVRRLGDGNCWMTSNLRFIGDGTIDGSGDISGTMTLDPTTSNVDTTRVISYTDLTSEWYLSGYKIHVGTDYNGDPTVWYSYSAASAGTVTSSSDTAEAVNDLCPAGWRLPTHDEQVGITSYASTYSPVGGGSYSSGSYSRSAWGYWWSSTAQDSIDRYYLHSSENGNLGTAESSRVLFGYYIRCIRNVSTTINFDGNGASSGSMSPQVITASGSGYPSGTLNKNTFRRSGYIFIGWNTARDGSGTAYADEGVYTGAAGNSNVTLYAQWAYSMQDFTKAMCQSEASSNSVNVADVRDNNVYSVRYINTDCWMTSNLRFIGDGTIDNSGKITGNMILSPTSSNVNSDTSSPISYTDTTMGNSRTEGRIHVGVDDNGDPTVWYNYFIAIAGTMDLGNTSFNPRYDICPRGWRLPNSSETNRILDYDDVFNPVIGGYYLSGSLMGANYGFWWSSDRFDTTYVLSLFWNGSKLKRSSNAGDSGHTIMYAQYIRCVRST